MLALWLVIGGVGTIAWIGAHLPPIQSLEIPKRPPSIQIVDVAGRAARHPRRHGRRGAAAEGTAELCAEGLHRHRGSALLRALRHRSLRHRARADCQYFAPRRHPGRLHHHAAIGEKSLFDSRAYRRSQAAGDAAGALAGAQIFQDADSRIVFEPRLFRLRRLRHRAGRAALFRQIRQADHPAGSGLARRIGEVAFASCTDAQFRRRRAARADRARRHDRARLYQRGQFARRARTSAARDGAGRQRLGQLRRRLDHGRDQRRRSAMSTRTSWCRPRSIPACRRARRRR